MSDSDPSQPSSPVSWESYQWPALQDSRNQPKKSKPVHHGPLHHASTKYGTLARNHQSSISSATDTNTQNASAKPDAIYQPSAPSKIESAKPSRTEAEQALFDAGIIEGRALAQMELTALDQKREALSLELKNLLGQREKMITQLTSESIAELGFDIASQAFGSFPKPSTEGWALLVKTIFEELQHKVGLMVIFAHPDDLPILQDTLTLLGPLSEKDALELRADASLNLGSLRMTRGESGAEYSFTQRLKKISESLACSYDQF